MKPFSANPRRITARALTRLRQSLQELGDLGGVVYDENSGQVVGGHQRLRAMFGEKAGEFSIQDTDIEIVKSYPEPTPQGTTAEGMITWQGGRFAFRQVKWDDPTFRRANFVANTNAGEMDWSVFANTVSIQDLQSWQIDPKEWLAQLNTDAGALLQFKLSNEETPDFHPVGIDEQGRLDQKKPVTCPECGAEFVPK